MVEHSLVAALISNWGGGGGPLRFLSAFDDDESTDADDAFSLFTRAKAPFDRSSVEIRGDLSPGVCIEGRISFFCLLAGRISSRSTGTPSDTRNSRRMRERTQSGGWSGGGATSCAHNDKLRSDRNIEPRSDGCSADILGTSLKEGYISSR